MRQFIQPPTSAGMFSVSPPMSSTSPYPPRPRTITSDSDKSNLSNSPNGSEKSTFSVNTKHCSALSIHYHDALVKSEPSSPKEPPEKILQHLYMKLNENVSRTGEPDDRVIICNQIGNILFRQGELDRAGSYYNLAIQYATTATLLATSYRNLATVCWRTGHLSQAIQYLESSLECEKIQAAISHCSINTSSVAMVYHQLGLCYALLKNFGRAHESLNKALGIRKDLGGELNADVARTLDALGRICFLETKYNYAIHYHRRALQIYHTLGRQDTSTIMQNLKMAYQATQKTISPKDKEST